MEALQAVKKKGEPLELTALVPGRLVDHLKQGFLRNLWKKDLNPWSGLTV